MRPNPIDWWAVTPAIQSLDAAGVAYGLHEYDRGEDLTDFGREAAEALGLPYDQVFKTLVVGLDDFVAVAVVPVDSRVSLKRVSAAFGKKKLQMCDPTRAERVTGYVVGGISPIGQKRLLPTVLDESAKMHPEIYVSGGRRGLDVSLAPGDLIRLLSAVVAPIAA